MHEVLVNRIGGLSLPRKSVVRLTDRPDMTLDVYRGRKTTMQQQQQLVNRYIFRESTVLFSYCLSSPWGRSGGAMLLGKLSVLLIWIIVWQRKKVWVGVVLTLSLSLSLSRCG